MLDLDWQARTIAVCSPTGLSDRFRLLLPALYAATERNLSVVCLWPLNNEVGFLPLDRLFQIRKRHGATSLTMVYTGLPNRTCNYGNTAFDVLERSKVSPPAERTFSLGLGATLRQWFKPQPRLSSEISRQLGALSPVANRSAVHVRGREHPRWRESAPMVNESLLLALQSFGREPLLLAPGRVSQDLRSYLRVAINTSSRTTREHYRGDYRSDVINGEWHALETFVVEMFVAAFAAELRGSINSGVPQMIRTVAASLGRTLPFSTLACK